MRPRGTCSRLTRYLRHAGSQIACHEPRSVELSESLECKYCCRHVVRCLFCYLSTKRVISNYCFKIYDINALWINFISLLMYFKCLQRKWEPNFFCKMNFRTLELYYIICLFSNVKQLYWRKFHY